MKQGKKAKEIQAKQQQNVLKKTGQYLIYLIRCSFHGEIPKEKPEDCTWELLFGLAKKNSVESTTSLAIQRYEQEIPKEIAREWKAAQNQTIYRQLHFDLEREQILTEMNAQGLSAMPLKGIYVAGYYPFPGMRWMCDNDILYGYVEPDSEGGFRFQGQTEKEQRAWNQKAEQELQKIMKGLGYKVEHLGGAHDVYQKPPFFNFEMHHRLAEPDSLMEVYYQNPWKHAKQKEENKQLYYFSDEDEYIYLMTHAYKHFAHAGCGIRTLADEYAILMKKSELDWEYVKAELKKLELDTFEEELRKTAWNAFSKDGELQQEDWKMIFYMLGCGTYGTTENRIRNRMKEMEKNQEAGENVRTSYLKERIWISESKMKEFYPFFYKHKAFRIILPAFRVVKGLILHPRRLVAEWKAWRTF